MTVLDIEGEGDDWRLHLNGDWSLSSVARIEAQLEALPGELHGRLVCDWSRSESPGIGPAWALLMRLADFGSRLEVRHTGDPPHFLDLLQRLQANRHAAAPRPKPASEGIVGQLGRWSVLQGRHARGVVDFFGRIVTVLGQAFRRPQALRLSHAIHLASALAVKRDLTAFVAYDDKLVAAAKEAGLPVASPA